MLPPDETPDSSVVFEEVSPYGSLMAVVEDDSTAVYLHLVAPEGSDIPTRSVWVRNRRPAPMGLEPGWQERGTGPALPFDACAHPVGLPALRPERLNAVWFPEGDAVALRDGTDVLAILPPWVGRDGCPGFARDCKSPTPVAWPLGRDPNVPILMRLAEATSYWDAWQRGEHWPDIQRGLVEAYDRAFGPHTRYFTIDGGKWPPRFLSEHAGPQGTTWVTGGMSLRPQPAVDRHYDQPATVRHVELALALEGSELAPAALNHLSQLCAMPWHMNAWLAPGHTVPARGMPVGPSGTEFPFFVVRPDTEPGLAAPPYRGEPVNLLWLVPITEAERELAVAQGSEALLERLDAAGVQRRHGDRRSVA